MAARPSQDSFSAFHRYSSQRRTSDSFRASKSPSLDSDLKVSAIGKKSVITLADYLSKPCELVAKGRITPVQSPHCFMTPADPLYGSSCEIDRSLSAPPIKKTSKLNIHATPFSPVEPTLTLISSLASLRFCAATPPCELCEKDLLDEEKARLKIIKEKKIYISLNGRSKLQPPDEIGETSIENILPELKINIREAFVRVLKELRPALSSYPDYVFNDFLSDDRLYGSGATNVEMGKPLQETLKDVDIVFYLKYSPIDEREIESLLAQLAIAVEKTLSDHIYDLPSLRELDKISLIRNYCLSDRIIVNDEHNKWLVISCGILGLRICIKADREYTASDYSYQVSLNKLKSYCLFGDRVQAERNFRERRLVMPEAEKIPNALGRTLKELLRHDVYSISDLTLVTDKYLETSTPDALITTLEKHLTTYTLSSPDAKLEKHLTTYALSPQALEHITSFLVASCQLKDPRKNEVIEKIILMLLKELKIEIGLTFDEKICDLIRKLIEQKLYYSAFQLINLFCEKNPSNLKRIIEFFLETSEISFITIKFFEYLIDLALKQNIEDFSFFLDIFRIIQLKNKSAFLQILMQRMLSIPFYLHERYNPFYLSVIEYLLRTEDKTNLSLALEIYEKAKILFPKELLLSLQLILCEKLLNAKILSKKNFQEFSDNPKLFENRDLVNRIVDFSLRNIHENEREFVELADILIRKWRKYPSFSSITIDEAKKVLLIYSKKISYATSIEELLEIIEDFINLPILRNNHDLLSQLIDKIEDSLYSLNFKNYSLVLKLLKIALVNSQIFDPDIKEKLKKIIFAMQNLIARLLICESSYEKKLLLLQECKNLFYLTQKSNLFSIEELSELSFLLSLLLKKAGFANDSLNFLFFSLPHSIETKKTSKCLCDTFNHFALSKKARFLKSHDAVLTHSLDKNSISKLHLDVLNSICLSPSFKTQSLAHLSDLAYFLEKGLDKKLYSVSEYRDFINKYLLTYSPSENCEIFKTESAICLRYLELPKGVISLASKNHFLEKCFSKNLKLSITKDDPRFYQRALDIFDDTSFLRRAMNIFNSNPNLQEKLLIILAQYLLKLSKDPQNLPFIISLLEKISPILKTIQNLHLNTLFSSILLNQNPRNLETLTLYLKLCDILFRSNQLLDPEVYRKPLFILRKVIMDVLNGKAKMEEVGAILSLLHQTTFWIAPVLEEEKKEVYSLLLTSKEIKTVDDLSGYISMMDSFLSQSIHLNDECFRLPLLFLQNAIANANDDTKKEEALLIFKLIQDSIFWNSSQLDEEKIKTFFSLISLFSSSTSKIKLFYFLIEKNILNSFKKYPAQSKNPWLNCDNITYSKLHTALLSWLNLEKDGINFKDVLSFYDLIRKYKINKEESLEEKKQLYEITFEHYMKEYEFVKFSADKENERIACLAECFVSWLRIIDSALLKLIEEKNEEYFYQVTSVILYNLWNYFLEKKEMSSIKFYEYLKQSNFDNSLDNILRTYLGKTLKDFTHEKDKRSKDELKILPPQKMLQELTEKLFPSLCARHSCFRELYVV